jgi:hypothetical protein
MSELLEALVTVEEFALAVVASVALAVVFAPFAVATASAFERLVAAVRGRCSSHSTLQ